MSFIHSIISRFANGRASAPEQRSRIAVTFSEAAVARQATTITAREATTVDWPPRELQGFS
jgi:hypothetical protein